MVCQKMSFHYLTLLLPGKERLERYMRHKWRLNHKPATFLSSLGSIVFFLAFYQTSDITTFHCKESRQQLANSWPCLVAHYRLSLQIVRYASKPGWSPVPCLLNWSESLAQAGLVFLKKACWRSLPAIQPNHCRAMPVRMFILGIVQ
jgi:hypothetical protein